MENNRDEEIAEELAEEVLGDDVQFDSDIGPSETGPVDVLDEESAGIRPGDASDLGSPAVVEDSQTPSEETVAESVSTEVASETTEPIGDSETETPDTDETESRPEANQDAEANAATEAAQPASPEAPVEEVNPFANFVKKRDMFKFVRRMREKMANGYDYIGTCMNNILNGDGSNCIMHTDIENNTMDVPAWYFGLDKDSLEPTPIDVRQEGFEDFVMISIAAGEDTCMPGNWRDKISIVDIPVEDLFRNIEGAKDYDPVFINVDAFRLSDIVYLGLFYTRDIPIMWNMEEYNKKKAWWTDKEGFTHVQLSVGTGTIVRFKDIIENPEKYLKFVKSLDATGNNPFVDWPFTLEETNPLYKFRNLPAVSLIHDEKGKIIPRVTLKHIGSSSSASYEETSEELMGSCILLSA